jgi:hypothetical protein
MQHNTEKRVLFRIDAGRTGRRRDENRSHAVNAWNLAVGLSMQCGGEYRYLGRR